MSDLGALASAARLWDAGGRDSADLYRGARLAIIVEQLEARAGSLTPVESDFVEASVRHGDAERLAVEERARVRERQNRRLRRSLVGLGVVLVVALVAGGIAVVQSRRAGQQRTKAQVAAAAANAAQQTAQDAANTASAAQKTAQDAASTATAAQRATAIDNLISESILLRSSRQDVAVLLAVEAYRLDPVAAKSAFFATLRTTSASRATATSRDVQCPGGRAVAPL